MSVQELLNEVRKISWNTQVAVRSYMVLRSKFCRSKISSNLTTVPANQAVRAMGISDSNNQQMSSSTVPIYAFYEGNLKRPSSFMQLTVARFEEHLSVCCGWIIKLEKLILKNTERTSSRSVVSMQSLPSIMSYLHNYFVHVAAKVERLHQYVYTMKAAYLADQRRRGDENNPFLEADRSETAKQEASARRLHPSRHVPSVSQPSTESAVLFTSSGLPVSSVPRPSSVFITP